MENNEKLEEFEGLPLRYAYLFLEKNGFNEQSNEIKYSKDKYKTYTSTLRRGKIIDLLDKNNLLNDFIEQYWQYGKTENGKRKIQRYKRIFDQFLNKDSIEQEDEEERIEETSFAYEDDLRDYLSNNLSIIENGLVLFKDKNGNEGIEYSIDEYNKRIDILALDKKNIPVVIELKVSRGYEKVIGQCLYYKNKVKKLFNIDKVRIIIIAREITNNLKIATEDINEVELFEYKLDIKLVKIK